MEPRRKGSHLARPRGRSWAGRSWPNKLAWFNRIACINKHIGSDETDRAITSCPCHGDAASLALPRMEAKAYVSTNS